MPFTFSHAAAVLPLRNTRLVLSALIIGSLSPDFSYVLQVFGPRVTAHSLSGVLFFCTPLSALIWLIYTKYLRHSWAMLFPWLDVSERPYRWVNVIASVTIGAASHILWDSFTHRWGVFVQWIPVLQSH